MSKSSVVGEMLPFSDWGRDVSNAEMHGGFVEDLVSDRFVAVQGIPVEYVEEMMRAYDEVMQLPKPSADYIWENYDSEADEVAIQPERDQEKHWHVYRTRLDKPGKPGGLTNRSLEYDVLSQRGLTDREASDRKEYFHFSPGMLDELRVMHAANNWGPIPSELERFLALAEPLHARSAEIMEGCIQAMEHHTAFNGIAKRLLENPAWRGLSPMRVLAYHTDGGDVLGQIHRDKGAATLAIDESHEGLRVSSAAKVRFDETKKGYVLLNPEEAAADENMQMVERMRGTAAFFVADGFRRETGVDHPATEPTYHDIVAVEGRRFSKEIARYAVIFFMNPASGTFSTKRENHL